MQQQPQQPVVLTPADAEYEGLTRWPGVHITKALIRSCDWLGSASFASSGAMLACEYGLNMTGATICGVATALGGGCVRDVVFAQQPMCIVDEGEYIVLCIAFAWLTFFFCCALTPEDRTLEMYQTVNHVLDTIGIAGFTVIACYFAGRRNLPLPLMLLCVIINCSFGGVIRDLFVGRPIRILNNNHEAYVECVVLGACCYLAMKKMGLSLTTRSALTWLTVVLARTITSTYGYRMPAANGMKTQQPRPATQSSAKETAPELK